MAWAIRWALPERKPEETREERLVEGHSSDSLGSLIKRTSQRTRERERVAGPFERTSLKEAFQECLFTWKLPVTKSCSSVVQSHPQNYLKDLFVILISNSQLSKTQIDFKLFFRFWTSERFVRKALSLDFWINLESIVWRKFATNRVLLQATLARSRFLAHFLYFDSNSKVLISTRFKT